MTPEDPKFLPKADMEWLSGILENVGEIEQVDDVEDFEMLTEEDKKGVMAAGYYGQAYYPHRLEEVPGNLDSAALEMMRTVAWFARWGGIVDTNNVLHRISVLAPSFSVKHVNIGARQKIKFANKMIEESVNDQNALNFHNAAKTHFSVLKTISEKALEFETKNGRGQLPPSPQV